MFSQSEKSLFCATLKNENMAGPRPSWGHHLNVVRTLSADATINLNNDINSRAKDASDETKYVEKERELLSVGRCASSHRSSYLLDFESRGVFQSFDGRLTHDIQRTQPRHFWTS